MAKKNSSTGRFELSEVVDAISFHANLRYFLKRTVLEVTAPDGRVGVLIGTYHGRHLVDRRYGLNAVWDIVCASQPECLILEARQQDLHDGSVFIAPVDMAFLALKAQEADVRVQGCEDWQAQFPSEHERRKRMVNAFLTTAGDGQRPVLVTGFSHTHALAKALQDAGWSISAFALATDIVRSSQSGATWPPSVDCALASSLTKIEANLQSLRRENEVWVALLERKNQIQTLMAKRLVT